MLDGLTYVAVAGLTRERLASIERLLADKIRTGRNVTPLERQVHFLVKSTRDAMALPPHLPNERELAPFARTLSQHTVAGLAGLTFPGFAAHFAPGQRWLADT